ncbi:MAG: hypothetical protein F4X51_18680 [Gemmatimonadetes bacterium]|nr:hypothetical protein [Gemmatimonadota bacterium]
MKLIHAEHIFTDIKSLMQDIKTYFNDLDSKNIESEIYASRIANELAARMENINGLIQTTLLAYLDKDAREEISDWKPVDQNRFYDKGIREKVSSQIRETDSFSPKVWPKKYIKIASGVVAAGGLYRSFSSPITFYSGTFISGMFIVVVAVGMFFFIPRVLDKHNKNKTLEELGAYLDAVEKRYKEQAQKIIDEYVSLFNEITPEKEKDGGKSEG